MWGSILGGNVLIGVSQRLRIWDAGEGGIRGDEGLILAW